MLDTLRSRDLVFDEGAVESALAKLKGSECDTLLALLPRLQRIIAEKTHQRVRQAGATLSVRMNGSSIPSEIIFKIFQHLDFDSILECRAVCRSFYSFATDPRWCTEVPKIAYHEGGRFSGSAQTLPETLKLLGRYPNLRKWKIPVKLDFSNVNIDAMDSIATALPRIQSVEAEIFHKSLTNEHVSEMLKRLPTLRSLTADAAMVPTDLANLTHLTIHSEEGSIDPEYESTSLRYLEYLGNTELIPRDIIQDCPNLEIIVCPNEGISDAPLGSAKLKSLHVSLIHGPRPLMDCPALTDLQYAHLCEDEMGESVRSDTVKHLRGGSQSDFGEEDVDLRLFPRVESFFVTTLDKPIHSNSLRQLAMEFQFRIPPGSTVDNLEWLSVSEAKEFDSFQNHQPSQALNFNRCNWPQGLRTLRIALQASCHDRALCTLFVKKAIAGLLELRELRINAVLNTPIHSTKLTELEVDGFARVTDLIKTVANCENLKVLRLSDPPINKHKGDNLSLWFWDEIAYSTETTRVKVMVPVSYRKNAPAPLREMLAKGRAAYIYPEDRSSFGLFNVYAA